MEIPSKSLRHGFRLSRAKEMLQLREEGKTFRAIGQKFGITRQRVMQTLKRIGRDDLLGHWQPARPSRKVPRHKCKREGCNNEVEKSPSRSGVYCSQLCFELVKNAVIHKIDEIVALRSQGNTWSVIQRRLNIQTGKGRSLPKRLSRLIELGYITVPKEFAEQVNIHSRGLKTKRAAQVSRETNNK